MLSGKFARVNCELTAIGLTVTERGTQPVRQSRSVYGLDPCLLPGWGVRRAEGKGLWELRGSGLGTGYGRVQPGLSEVFE